jgi:hypothetical protein
MSKRGVEQIEKLIRKVNNIRGEGCRVVHCNDNIVIMVPQDGSSDGRGGFRLGVSDEDDSIGQFTRNCTINFRGDAVEATIDENDPSQVNVTVSGSDTVLFVEHYTCDDSSSTCVLNATAAVSGSVSTLKFKSGCQVGDVRWTTSSADEVRGEVWTLAVIESASGAETTTKPVTTLKFGDGYTSGAVPDGNVVFDVVASNDERNDNGEKCGGKIVTITGTVQGFGLMVRWDPDPNDTTKQNPVKDIYLKDTSNGGTLPNKTQGINFTVTKDPDADGTDTKIKVEANAAIALGDLANVDLASTPVSLAAASTTRYPHALVWDNDTSTWVRCSRTETTVTSFRYYFDEGGTNKRLQRRTATLSFFGRVDEGTWEDVLKLTAADTVDNVNWDTSGADPKLTQAKRQSLLITVAPDGLPSASSSDIVTFKPCNTGGS